jgi:hypothetical protein
VKPGIISTVALLTLVQLLAVARADPDADGASAPAPVMQALPKLKIAWSCSDCTQNPKVIPLIQQAYRAEAAKYGWSVSETETADVAIVAYRQRNPGVRVGLGIFAGKDRLELKISFNGKELSASDYSANAVQGMNYLCESVGKQAFMKIAGSFQK